MKNRILATLALCLTVSSAQAFRVAVPVPKPGVKGGVISPTPTLPPVHASTLSILTSASPNVARALAGSNLNNLSDNLAVALKNHPVVGEVLSEVAAVANMVKTQTGAGTRVKAGVNLTFVAEALYAVVLALANLNDAQSALVMGVQANNADVVKNNQDLAGLIQLLLGKQVTQALAAHLSGNVKGDSLSIGALNKVVALLKAFSAPEAQAQGDSSAARSAMNATGLSGAQVAAACGRK